MIIAIPSNPSRPPDHNSHSPQHSSNNSSDLDHLVGRIESSGMSPEANQICLTELDRLRSIPKVSVEHSLIRNYLDVMLQLPWSTSSDNNCLFSDHGFLSRARLILDKDHHGMFKVKDRLIQFLAILKLRHDLHQSHSKQLTVVPSLVESKNDHHQIPQPVALTDGNQSRSIKSPIILLVGPAGVGKTSIAKSIARALGKKFYRISLGGVRDEAEIRGHRRTYVGSMTGCIVQALRRVRVNDPVILLDEIDKVGGQSLNGDPSAALLEVLDPEQNRSFVDHYINTPIDLSSVLFISTANTTSTISTPLLDRMEVIELSGYLTEEKLMIAKRHLIPKKGKGMIVGFEKDQEEDVLRRLILGWTREPGVRGLEREIEKLCRFKATEWVEFREKVEGTKSLDERNRLRFDPIVRVEDLRRILGVERYEVERTETDLRPGVVIGMAYQSTGIGVILFIESTILKGSGSLNLTGSIGPVIKESIQISLTWIRSNSDLLRSMIKKPMIHSFDDKSKDLHLHFPTGSLKKEGPSIGVGLILCLISLSFGIRVSSTLAVSGEISLRGKVLAVGGIREKILAAQRAGIRMIILPRKNQRELMDDSMISKFLIDQSKDLNLKDQQAVRFVYDDGEDHYKDRQRRVRSAEGYDDQAEGLMRVFFVDEIEELVRLVFGSMDHQDRVQRNATPTKDPKILLDSDGEVKELEQARSWQSTRKDGNNGDFDDDDGHDDHQGDNLIRRKGNRNFRMAGPNKKNGDGLVWKL
ncbi:Lon protease C-terminal proteolytic domain-containing protein [Phakopsora pachyrhizi]|nr:Lon protease C-terminal proteolytic domain-containing protein [Phakopsora pachyrhizi]